MRRLIEWLYSRLFGLQIRSNQQHHADLQRYLDELTAARQQIDEEIDSTLDALLKAIERGDSIARRQSIERLAQHPTTEAAQ